MKETEEETHNRLRSEISAHPNAGQDYIFKLCKAYHQERMKSSLPSEEEIDDQSAEKYPDTDKELWEMVAYRQGFKDALTLLTKIDR